MLLRPHSPLPFNLSQRDLEIRIEMSEHNRGADGVKRRRERRAPRKPTLKEVAKDAGVSVSTVSHVVNETRFVNDDTRARVESSIARLGYAPNRLAQSLRRSSPGSIGLIVSDVGNPYYTDVIRGVEDECRRRGMTVLLASSDDDPAREEAALLALRAHQVDGLIVALTSGTTDRVLQEIVDFDQPAVLVDRFSDVGIDQVGSENIDSTDLLVSHLIEHGHTRIGFLSGVEGISTSDERLTGYRRALDTHRIAFDPSLVASGRSRIDPAADAASTILATADAPTAFVAGNNLMALGVLKAALRAGLTVPTDLALVSFDDFDWTELLHPRLTTMAQPTYEIGRRAIEALLNRLQDPSSPPQSVRLTPTFMHRDSCGCSGGAI